MKVRLNRNQDGILEADCSDLEAWEHGDRLIRYLKHEFGAHVDDKAESPDARRWFITVDNQKLSVDQSDFGFLSFAPLSATDATAENVVRHVAEHLEKLTMGDWMRMTEGPVGRLVKMFKRE